MDSGRKVYQVLLVKNIFQRNFPEIHCYSDIRPATWEQVQAEIKRLKIKWRATLSSSSPKKNSITSLDEYYRLDELYHDAYDRVQSGGMGGGIAVFIKKS
jgi:hypothetical protein